MELSPRSVARVKNVTRMSLVPATEESAALVFCRQVLPAVSRTFALNIPVLPAPLDTAVLGRRASSLESTRSCMPPPGRGRQRT